MIFDKLKKNTFLSENILSILFSCIFLSCFMSGSAQIVEVVVFFLLLFLCSKKKSYIASEYRRIIYAALVFFFVQILVFVYGKEYLYGFSSLNPYINYFVSALIMLFLFGSKIKIKKDIVLQFVAIAGILNGLLALYQAFVLDIGRVGGGIGIFKFSQVSGSISVILFVALLFSKNRRFLFFYLTSFLFSMSAVVLTETRGTYVGLLLCLLVLAFFLKTLKNRIFGVIFLVSVYLLVGFFAASSKTDFANISGFQQDMSKYASGNVDSSNGLRIEMWKEALAIFSISPIFGMRSQGVDENLEEIIKRSKTKRTFNELVSLEEKNPDLSKYPKREIMVKEISKNRHNQFFDTLANSGLLGISSLIFLIFSIFLAFKKNNSEQPLREVSLIGIGLLAFFCGCGIGDVPFSSNFMVPYIMIVCSIFLKIKMQEKENAL